MVFNNLQFSKVFFIGVVPIFVGFFIVSLLTHYENVDPMKDLVVKLCSSKRTTHDGEQESLLAEEKSDSVPSEHV